MFHVISFSLIIMVYCLITTSVKKKLKPDKFFMGKPSQNSDTGMHKNLSVSFNYAKVGAH